MGKLTKEMEQALCAPLPDGAISPHPAKSFLSVIKDIYIIERLNQVFGIGAWKVKVEHVTTEGKMVVVKVIFSIPEYDIEHECYGGNDNADLGDAYKGATTDALTKICSWLGIANDVWKRPKAPQQAAPPKQTSSPKREILTDDMLMDSKFLDTLCNWLHDKWSKRKYKTSTAADILRYFYECSDNTLRLFLAEYERRYTN